MEFNFLDCLSSNAIKMQCYEPSIGVSSKLVQYKVDKVLDYLYTTIMGLNPAQSMDVCVFQCCFMNTETLQ
jgi:hypothetical protein